MRNELPEECELCGAVEEAESTAVKIVARCAECSAACCESCLPAGVGTICVTCEENEEQRVHRAGSEDEASTPPQPQ